MTAAPRSGFRAVAGVGLYFSCNGLVFAALLPWYPLLVERLGLSDWQFGLIVASFAFGAIVSSVVPARLISRFGANAVVVAGTVLLGLAAAATAWSVNGWMMAACLFFVGFFDAIVDVAQNVVGISVQESLSRTVLSSMHALWSLGGLVSGAAATAAAAEGMDMRVHLALIAVISIIVILLARRMVGDTARARRLADSGTDSDAEAAAGGRTDTETTSGESSSDRAKHRSKRAVVLMALPLAVVAICGTAVEDIANNWSAIAAVEFGGVRAAAAGIAFSVVIGSQCLGRFSGDLLVQRFGASRIARIGGGCIALGGVGVVTASEPFVLLAGLALMGYGSATLVPGALGAAAHIPGVGRAGGVTLVNWIMRVGFLGTSPLIGVIASTANLRWGLSLLILIGVVTMIFSGRLDRPAGRCA
ncbi:MFS transporter [Brevibacterium marinum]|uniref:MFS family permease n=1 Tax=Brevibacterium marinum TaxID=418643 RepID=A0A846S0E1_9MICO|nr:MFS transporter [Brevibacterium marinum]NJC57145.1 MFS family permease [Brevibacterium marinum]